MTECHNAKVNGLNYDENCLRAAMCHAQVTAQKFYLQQEVATRATLIIKQCTAPAASVMITPPACAVVQSTNTSTTSAALPTVILTQTPAIASSTATPVNVSNYSPAATTPAARSALVSSVSVLQSAVSPLPSSTSESSTVADITITSASPPVAAGSNPTATTPAEGSAADEDEEQTKTRSLTQVEKDKISEEFGDVIAGSQTVLLADVRRRLRNANHVSLRKLLLYKGMDLKVANRVRHCQGMAKAASPPAESQVSAADKVMSWDDNNEQQSLQSGSSTGRWEWDEEDVKLLKEAFAHLPTYPSLQQIREQAATSPTLNQLIERCTPKRAFNKLKNDWRKDNK